MQIDSYTQEEKSNAHKLITEEMDIIKEELERDTHNITQDLIIQSRNEVLNEVIYDPKTKQ